MPKEIIDLHVHSTESDGTFTPEELIQEARRVGLKAMALTDHDTFCGIEKARPFAEKENIELIPGVELSTNYNGKEIHILGLYIDINNDKLIQETAKFRECRDNRNVEMVELLRREGFDITMEALEAENPDCVITRANIARFMLDHGMIKSIREAFDKYIGDGCKCYVSRHKITPMDAVKLIKEANGIAVLAHPLLYHMNTNQLQLLIDELKSAGLDGIEAIYSTYTPGEEKLVKRLAKENQLLITGGSDFHGENKPYINLGTGKGQLSIPYSILEKIKAALL